MSRRFRFGEILVLLSCHWRLALWRAPFFWTSFRLVHRADGKLLGFTSLFIGCEFAVLRLPPDADVRRPA